ncbi:hypothetical protein M378DRAFT_734234 [Amanita muscaria Koide BX008]|uniref:Secreted protein n=1 Tax=Amanita muscaria (strain Koide BX008) TaxID=946122 RepID=A0A0C2SLE4_AMAMK|nr:hypothetical protein M378DRAFT_734234 [Amanita muscaria Koide BX008]
MRHPQTVRCLLLTAFILSFGVTLRRQTSDNGSIPLSAFPVRANKDVRLLSPRLMYVSLHHQVPVLIHFLDFNRHAVIQPWTVALHTASRAR